MHDVVMVAWVVIVFEGQHYCYVAFGGTSDGKGRHVITHSPALSCVLLYDE